MDGITVYISVFISFISLAIGQATADIGLNTCRMQLSCGDDIVANSVGSRPVGIPGKHGPVGPPGLKGAKGEPCDCGGKLVNIENRLDILETPRCPQTTFDFPASGQITDWIRLKVPVQRITEIMICFWVTPHSLSSTAARSVVSYATRKDNNALLLELTSTRINLLLNAQSNGINFPIGGRTHLCAAGEPTLGRGQIYVNGKAYSQMSYSGRSVIEGGGSLLVGQEQDAFMGKLDPNQAFSGILENPMIWYRLLDAAEISRLHSHPCSCPTRSDIAFTSDQIQIAGKVASIPVNQC